MLDDLIEVVLESLRVRGFEPSLHNHAFGIWYRSYDLGGRWESGSICFDPTYCIYFGPYITIQFAYGDTEFPKNLYQTILKDLR